jgi:S-DNA-T family DNA segregation ATPase FtsK/SpoIIIE
MTLNDVVNIARVVVFVVLFVGLGTLALGTVNRVVNWLRATPAERARLRLARRVRRSWKHLTANLGLAYTDETTRYRTDRNGRRLPPVTRVPRMAVILHPYGVTVEADTLPGVGVEEYVNAAPHLANAWGLASVQVRQLTPGRVELRGLLSDPVLDPVPFVPVRGAASFDAVSLGRDEYGNPARISLVNVSGITIGGLPGYGKTSLIADLFCQLAPRPDVQWAFLDGKGGADYDDMAPRAFLVGDDDIEAANRALKKLFEHMRDRHAVIKAVRGTANIWHAGPSIDWPLIIVVVDESHTFVQTSRKATKPLAEENAWYLEQIAKKGRSVGYLLIMVTQKQTGDAIPTAIRDVCQIGLTSACRTIDGAVAALGDDIRAYPDASPVKLLGPEYVGVFVASLPGRAGFTRIRCPEAPSAFVAATATASAPVKADPADLLANLTRPRLVELDKTTA